MQPVHASTMCAGSQYSKKVLHLRRAVLKTQASRWGLRPHRLAWVLSTACLKCKTSTKVFILCSNFSWTFWLFASESFRNSKSCFELLCRFIKWVYELLGSSKKLVIFINISFNIWHSWNMIVSASDIQINCAPKTNLRDYALFLCWCRLCVKKVAYKRSNG